MAWDQMAAGGKGFKGRQISCSKNTGVRISRTFPFPPRKSPFLLPPPGQKLLGVLGLGLSH